MRDSSAKMARKPASSSRMSHWKERKSWPAVADREPEHQTDERARARCRAARNRDHDQRRQSAQRSRRRGWRRRSSSARGRVGTSPLRRADSRTAREKVADGQNAVRSDQPESLHSERTKGDADRPVRARAESTADGDKPSKFWHLQPEFRGAADSGIGAAAHPRIFPHSAWKVAIRWIRCFLSIG